jgi:hypothetical protein
VYPLAGPVTLVLENGIIHPDVEAKKLAFVKMGA